MRVTNDPAGGGPSGAFAEMFRLQADFQARLAEETLRYLRRLQGAVVPAAPGTVVMPGQDLELRGQGEPGDRATLALDVENMQRVHCMVTPQLTPLVSAAGVTWFPAVEAATSSKLIAPNAVETLALALPIPGELPAGEYRGAVLLQGFRQNSLPVVITVGMASPTSPTTPATKTGPVKTGPATKVGPLTKSKAGTKQKPATKAGRAPKGGPAKKTSRTTPPQSGARAGAARRPRRST
jgi:hypothetical protein